MSKESEVGCTRDDGLLNVHKESEFCEVCKPAAANKAAEEGGLPALPKPESYNDDGYIVVSYSDEQMRAYARAAIAADRASRQVANKVEVEPAAWMVRNGKDYPGTLGIYSKKSDADVIAKTWSGEIVPLYATPTATTGAMPKDLAIQCLNALDVDSEAHAALSKFIIEGGAVGASTVLTDERIKEEMHAYFSYSGNNDNKFWAHVDDIVLFAQWVAAQAGQVAEKDRLLKALERAAIAESALRRLADEVENDSVPGWEDRLMACIAEANSILNGSGAGQVAVPGWKLVPAEPTEAMVHAAEDLPAPRMFAKVYRAMIGAALSPAKESK